MNFSGQIEGKPCEIVIRDSAQHLNDEIVFGIKDGLMRNELCNTTEGVLILHKEETVEYTSQKVRFTCIKAKIFIMNSKEHFLLETEVLVCKMLTGEVNYNILNAGSTYIAPVT